MDFCCSVLGFQLRQRFVSQAAFLAAGGCHHHLGLNAWKSRTGKARERRDSTTWRFPNRTGPRWPTHSAACNTSRFR
ncbi:MAG: hypothetical protein PHQ04_05950 [Opitutaceae bacterium]|nr:hypothetical protein [Opitutaceae bacterium]